MQKSLIPAALLAMFLAACGGNTAQQSAASVASAPASEVMVSAPAEMASEAVEMASEATTAAMPAGELPAVCKEAEADENKYIETLSGAEKEERIKSRDEWLASLQQVSAAEQEENCKQHLDEMKEDN